MKLTVIGAGAFGTALANTLVNSKENEITLFTIEKDVAENINNDHNNNKYFPNIRLNHKLKATTSLNEIRSSDVVFMAIPSSSVIPFVKSNMDLFHPECIIVNLAKGFGIKNTIIEELCEIGSFDVCTLKGPIFAAEAIYGLPAGLTLGSKNEQHFSLFKRIFCNTNIYLDYTSDLRGVEYLSILKNIYAIALGIIDANYNSSNARFYFLTNAFNEAQRIHKFLGGQETTMFRYCGFGDFCLTALNDLSRNRTLGLLIGKHFFDGSISNSVVLEGVRSIEILFNKVNGSIASKNICILKNLHSFFKKEISIACLINMMLENSSEIIHEDNNIGFE